MTHGFRLFIWCLVVLLTNAGVTSALPARSYERAELFATCSGRLEALSVRQRAHHQAEAQDSETLRALFETLLDAVLPHALSEGVPVGQPRKWRDQGWIEVAALMAHAQYSRDKGKAERAWQAMEQRIDSCRAAVL